MLHGDSTGEQGTESDGKIAETESMSLWLPTICLSTCLKDDNFKAIHDWKLPNFDRKSAESYSM